MNVRFDKKNPPTTEPDIAHLETVTGIRLPEPYRRFLLEHNGGAPLPDKVAVPGWYGGFTGLNTFFGIGTRDDLQKNFLGAADHVPKGFLPIADDPGGNLFCLGLAGRHVGAVYLWDHEDELDEDGDPKKDMSNMYKVADSIDDLLANKLLPDD